MDIGKKISMITIVFTTIGKVKKEYVVEALDSIKAINNTLITEVIIFDSSLDGEFSNFLKYELKKRNIVHTYIQNTECLSMGANWNKALEKVSTPWVLFNHDDDILNFETVNKLTPLDLKYSMYVYGYETIQGSKKVDRVIINQSLQDIVNRTPKFISTIINVQKIRDLSGWSDRFGYFLDYVGMVKLASLSNFKAERIILGKYRLHEQNASHINQRFKGYAEYIHEVIHEIYPLLPTEELKRSFLYHVCSYSYPNKALMQKIISRVVRVLGYKAWLS